MKELVVISGKGGTGKTSISAALAWYFPKKVLVDCDVDAANFHLIAGADPLEKHAFTAGFEPFINTQACNRCGKCTALCRFQAVTAGELTNPFHCEGCGVCAFHCPQHAIQMKERAAGHWFISHSRFGTLFHAELGLSIENSGKLVSKVRTEAKKAAVKQKMPLLITDGPPGIGCPAIAALSGASMALAVIEPSESGIHDVKRLIELTTHFRLPVAVCINKSSLQPDNTRQIAAWCQANGLAVAGQLPYSEGFRQGVQQGKTLWEVPGYEEEKAALEVLCRNLAVALELPAEESTLQQMKRKVQAFFSPMKV